MYKLIILFLLSFDSIAQNAVSDCTINAHKKALDFELFAFQSELEHYNSNDGFIALALENRRKHEQLCYVAANCFDKEPNKSIEFTSCLEGWENELQD